ncbi:MAG: hypothetical protein GF329_19625 [Candidatus Lokiarchaeota archaeon]|nr:hypothetical protein [Candidatus Lokiarchaeota archaeon]
MNKEKWFKKLWKSAMIDDYKNIIMLLRYLYETGGTEKVREYYKDYVPNYLIDYQGLGKGKLMMIKAWKKSSSSGYMHKICDNIIKERLCWYHDDYEILEDDKNKLVYKINCDFIKSMKKHSKKFNCDFDIREVFCENACIPLLKQLFKTFLLNLEIETTNAGCIQKTMID